MLIVYQLILHGLRRLDCVVYCLWWWYVQKLLIDTLIYVTLKSVELMYLVAFLKMANSRSCLHCHRKLNDCLNVHNHHPFSNPSQSMVVVHHRVTYRIYIVLTKIQIVIYIIITSIYEFDGLEWNMYTEEKWVNEHMSNDQTYIWFAHLQSVIM